MKAIARKFLVILLLASVAFGATGCGSEDLSLIRELAIEWAKANALDIGKYTFLGRSGNDEVDAVMGAKDVVDNIMAADKLMEEGRAKGDLGKMEQAIQKRPGDYTYRVSYGTALLRQGQAEDAEAQFLAADEAVMDNYGEPHVQRYAIQGIEELSAVGAELEKNGFASQAQCKAYNERMAFFYGLRYEGTQEKYFLAQQEHFLAQAEACK